MDLVGPNGGKIAVYLITDLLSGEKVYAGSGRYARVISHLFKGSKVARHIAHGNYAIDVLWDGDDDRMALSLESVLIFAYRPTLNKQRFGTRGGRPKGSKATLPQRRHLSKVMRGRASEWMTGATPWNKGLTKNDHPGLMASSVAKIGNKNGALKPGEKGRPRGKPAWNKGMTVETSRAMKKISEKMRGRPPWNKGKKTGGER